SSTICSPVRPQICALLKNLPATVAYLLPVHRPLVGPHSYGVLDRFSALPARQPVLRGLLGGSWYVSVLLFSVVEQTRCLLVLLSAVAAFIFRRSGGQFRVFARDMGLPRPSVCEPVPALFALLLRHRFLPDSSIFVDPFLVIQEMLFLAGDVVAVQARVVLARVPVEVPADADPLDFVLGE